MHIKLPAKKKKCASLGVVDEISQSSQCYYLGTELKFDLG